MAKRSKYVKPEDRHILEANVVASKQISPNFVRVTIGGDGLQQFSPMGEIDIDFVSHGDGGPASAWAAKAAPGDQVAFLDEGLIYNPTEDYEWQLLVGDESALPAIMGIVSTAPRDLKAEVFLEIPHADDAQTVAAPEGVDIHWVIRTDAHTHPGLLALAAVQDATLPDGPSYTYIAGERELATSLRRHLVNDRKFPKSNVTFTGYWRFGKAQG